MSRDITRVNTNKIALYNNKDTACCADSGASEDMFPDYSTFNTYHRLSNSYADLGDTTSLTIEGICTAIYTLNVRTNLTHNSFHFPFLQFPLFSICNYLQRPVFGVYSYYKDGS